MTDPGLIVEAGSSVAAVTNVCPIDTFVTVSHNSLTAFPAQLWDGTAWVAVDGETGLHILFVRLYVIGFMLE
jgi:hypothetical protein